jgi:hypothetical protein
MLASQFLSVASSWFALLEYQSERVRTLYTDALFNLPAYRIYRLTGKKYSFVQ